MLAASSHDFVNYFDISYLRSQVVSNLLFFLVTQRMVVGLLHKRIPSAECTEGISDNSDLLCREKIPFFSI